MDVVNPAWSMISKSMTTAKSIRYTSLPVTAGTITPSVNYYLIYMKFYITINYKGQTRAITIIPESYLDKKVYYLEQWGMTIYKHEDRWKCDTDHQMENSLLQLIGDGIQTYHLTHTEDGQVMR
jgi:hypothetical protein